MSQAQGRRHHHFIAYRLRRSRKIANLARNIVAFRRRVWFDRASTLKSGIHFSWKRSWENFDT
jgi:hypothetical protein